MAEQPRILRPRPRRVFDVTPASTESSEPPTPAEPANSPDLLSPNQDMGSTSASVSRTGSIMNLTSSTLYGIYSPTAFSGFRGEDSPWGTEALNTPTAEFPPEPSQREAVKSATEPRRFALRRTRSRLSHGLVRGVILPQALSSALLFGFGVVYGVITVHLHDNHWITPVKLENVHYYDSWLYLGFWGLAGTALGNVLPWLDGWREKGLENQDKRGNNAREEETGYRSPSWVAVARSVGAFVGIAFAMVSLSFFFLTRVALFGSTTTNFAQITETTSLAIHHTSIADPRSRQPRPVVPHRPHQDRIPPRGDCRYRGHGRGAGPETRAGP